MLPVDHRFLRGAKRSMDAQTAVLTAPEDRIRPNLKFITARKLKPGAVPFVNGKRVLVSRCQVLIRSDTMSVAFGRSNGVTKVIADGMRTGGGF